MKKIVSIVGARPQFVKLSPLSKKLSQYVEEIVIHTGQHYDENMSKVFFDELGIKKPDYNLEVGSGKHGVQTAEMMLKLEEILENEEPDLCIIFGDTNSTLAGALVASKLGVTTLHIEAGLRSFNRSMPEEINRIVADHLSDHLFAPNQISYDNLLKEGLHEKSVITGDIMVDSVLDNSSEASAKSLILDELGIVSSDYYLVTLHRPYNVDNIPRLKNIFIELSKLNKNIVFPVHPRTRKIISDSDLKISNRILLTDPVGYFDFLKLMQNSYKIITDSGGIQKEAYILKKPCITLRHETEWTETVTSGWNLLIDLNEDQFFADKIINFIPPNENKPLFGDNVSEKMLKEILVILNK